MNQQILKDSCLLKQGKIKELFAFCTTSDQKYEKIIALGKSLAPYPEEFKTPDKLVGGCQSLMYLHAPLIDGKLHFRAHSEALISAGLAALLIFVYCDESPEAILTTPPYFLDELGIPASLSPSRSNGLASLFAKMQKEALNALVASNKNGA